MCGGSSPHTRGARGADPRQNSQGGIIPAYAGSTGGPHTTSKARWDHPRIRGEHERPEHRDGIHVGSSPHTRGARLRQARPRRTQGIIPAYAGSTLGGGAVMRIEGGSSPHTRGAQLSFAARVCLCRIIPAYAGSTEHAARVEGPRVDHPRIRGEHVLVVAGLDAYEGSSPHTRGAPMTMSVRSSWAGIIPAYAGSTPFCAGAAS